MYDIKFDQKEIKKVEKDYSNVQTTSEQQQWIEQTAGIYVKYITISEMAMKGFILHSMRKYQVDHKFDLREYLSLSKAEKEKINKEMIELIRGRLNMVLIDKNQVPLLQKASDDVLAFVNKL